MTPPSWSLVQDLFHGALERPAAERNAWIAEHSSDEAIREEVRSLLESLQRQGSYTGHLTRETALPGVNGNDYRGPSFVSIILTHKDLARLSNVLSHGNHSGV